MIPCSFNVANLTPHNEEKSELNHQPIWYNCLNKGILSSTNNKQIHGQMWTIPPSPYLEPFVLLWVLWNLSHFTHSQRVYLASRQNQSTKGKSSGHQNAEKLGLTHMGGPSGTQIHISGGSKAFEPQFKITRPKGPHICGLHKT